MEASRNKAKAKALTHEANILPNEAKAKVSVFWPQAKTKA